MTQETPESIIKGLKSTLDELFTNTFKIFCCN